ncbi:MAG: type IX secretion system sortase PorU [Chlorobi bacterium]|nr:type IX secretion system sortase PorU [Chlorobiota bacterium]
MRKISWQVPTSGTGKTGAVLIPTFYGAEYTDSADYPFYTELVELPAGTDILHVILQNPVFQSYPSVFKSLPGSITLQFHEFETQKKKFVRIQIPAVISGKPSSSDKLLTQFIIQIFYGPQKKSAQAIDFPATKSVLAAGTWAKVSVTHSGIYKITYEDLTGWGIPDPEHPKIYGNGGREIPEFNNEEQPDDLQEIPVRFYKGSDGIFNQGDYLLFYAEGPVTWKYDNTRGMFLHHIHQYDDATYYFVTSGAVSEIPLAEPPSASAGYQTSTYNDFLYHEENTENLIKSGREWYEPIVVTGISTFSFEFPGRIESEPVETMVRFAGRAGTTSIFTTKVNGITSGNLSIPAVNLSSYTSDFAKSGTGIYSSITSGSNIQIDISIQTDDPASSRAWLDYIDINVRRALSYDGQSFSFRDLKSVSPGNITEFSITSSVENTHIWDITDIHRVKEINSSATNNVIRFKAYTDSLREYVIFSGNNFPGVNLVESPLNNQDLHSSAQTDMIIVTHPDFLAQAEALADLHRTRDGLTVTVATTNQVYNEFSSGARDAGAIRNFIRMFYNRATGADDLPRYLLLFGDGSFDNLSDYPGNTNFIPTWQSENSLSPTRSFVSDDFFGLLDENEGGATGLVDIGIGRFPVISAEEASIIIDKIRKYTQPDARGDWRNNICFIGDDEDNNIHMRDANTLATYIENYYPAFSIDKIFLDAWPQETTSSGDRYPGVNQAINERVQHGTLIVNYVGHGNERGLAHENILGIADINRWKNIPRLPLFVTATCEFSRFDDVDREITGEISPKTSAGEWVLLNPEGGGIALLTTTRLVYSSPNFVLNQNFYKYIFATRDGEHPNTLGDAMRLTKNISGSGINKRNFSLLGDPALVLAYPRYRIITDSLNHTPVNQPLDTLKALSLVTISGHLEDIQGNILSSKDGTVMPVIFDKPRNITTLGNDDGPLMTFSVQDNILFKGKANIRHGFFNFSLRIPKDIAYNPGKGKLSYYAEFDSVDAAGSDTDIIVGGFTDEIIPDTEGPDILLYLNDTLFIDGGIADRDPVLLARIYDRNGINTVGNGIGHDLIAVLDGNYTSPLVLNNYFEYDLDSYQRGIVTYPVFNLAPGNHIILVKAWDNLNNSSEAELRFKVTDEEEGMIEPPVNFPNPFTDDTYITFQHTLSSEELEIEVRIYRFDGTLVRILKTHLLASGYRIPPIRWDGKDANGQKTSAGIYVFRAFVRSGNGESYSGSNKMIKLR